MYAGVSRLVKPKVVKFSKVGNKVKGEESMEYLIKIGKQAKEAATLLNKLSQNEKNEALLQIADALEANQDAILSANVVDVQRAKEKGIKESLVDRLSLTPARIHEFSNGLRDIVLLPDPIGEVTNMTLRPNGLQIGQKRVPIGVIGIIYESRPNVTVDAFGLCFKTNNATILRGGSDAIESNTAIVKVITDTLKRLGLSEYCLQLITDTSRDTAQAFMRLNQYIDVLIPRGGAGLIKTVIENSTIPVIETGTGNCHAYVDETADFKMALNIIVNGKTQRTGVCNALESLVVHRKVAKVFLPLLYQELTAYNVEIRGDKEAVTILPDINLATEEDYQTEYLDLIISLKIVDSIDEAIAHINRYNTKHSEVIITKDYQNAMKFLNEVDAAAVYVNASTRFTDGAMFGLGAEIGISTQKLHARGPMGLQALTTIKYIIFGDGQIR